MAARLYYDDSYLQRFEANVMEADESGRRVVLGQTAFYPTSGGQPHDLGTLGAVPVIEVLEEHGQIVHVLQSPLGPKQVAGQIDWPRRFDHMQQHTGQHLLSAVLATEFNVPTVSFHLGAESSTIDLSAPALDAEALKRVERRCNEVVTENRPVTISSQDASETSELRKPSDRQGTLRIISIEDLDRSACGGTHVRATGEIGPVLLRRLDKVRGNVRLEFLCGMRAVRRARADYDALAAVAKVFASSLDEAPALVESQLRRMQDLEKRHRRLAMELADLRAARHYEQQVPGPDGIRRWWLAGDEGTPDEWRPQAEAFTSRPQAVCVACAPATGAALVAVSGDSGLHAGDVLKSILTALSGRGGGNARVAQGSVPAGAGTALAAALRKAFGFTE